MKVVSMSRRLTNNGNVYRSATGSSGEWLSLEFPVWVDLRVSACRLSCGRSVLFFCNLFILSIFCLSHWTIYISHTFHSTLNQTPTHILFSPTFIFRDTPHKGRPTWRWTLNVLLPCRYRFHSTKFHWTSGCSGVANCINESHSETQSNWKWNHETAEDQSGDDGKVLYVLFCISWHLLNQVMSLQQHKL